MKILVGISSVPDTTSKINFTENNKQFDKTGGQFVINPMDEFCLSKAIQLQEKNQAEVTVITVGDTSVEPVMRKTLAIGANKAIRINTEPKDSITVAKEIATAFKEEEYSFVLMGKESLDYNGGEVPGLLAAVLDLPFVNAVISLEIEGNNAKVIREIDGGKEYLQVNLPAVFAGQKGIVEEKELKIPNMRGIMSARTKPLTVKEPQNYPPMLESVEYEKPSTRQNVKMIDKDNLDELVRLLHEEAKVI